MTQGQPDHLLAPDYLADLEARSTAEIRRMRAECEAVEEGVSYARRLVQGRLDILRAELAARDEAGDMNASELLAELPAILGTDRPHSGPAQARATRLRVPDSAAPFEERLDDILDGVELVDLEEHELGRLGEVSTRLAGYEHELSQLRRQLFERIDALRDELARRYRDGRADVSELLAGS